MLIEARDESADPESCAGSILDRFTGPDGKEYSFEVKNYQPTISKRLRWQNLSYFLMIGILSAAVPSDETVNKIQIHIYNPTGQSVYYEYTGEGELLGLSKFFYIFFFRKWGSRVDLTVTYCA